MQWETKFHLCYNTYVFFSLACHLPLKGKKSPIYITQVQLPNGKTQEATPTSPQPKHPLMAVDAPSKEETASGRPLARPDGSFGSRAAVLTSCWPTSPEASSQHHGVTAALRAQR